MYNDRLLRELLPYRMNAVATLNLALKLQATLGAAPMNIYANGTLVIEGNLNAFNNPAIEAGLMHCRVLLEFLGLCMTGDGRLGNINKRRRSDVGIENFSNSSGHLKKVAPDEALSRYPLRKEAENALLAVFQTTNKGLAHVTEDLIENPEHGSLIEIASRGVPSLMVSYLYTPLGLPEPDYKLTHRSRND